MEPSRDGDVAGFSQTVRPPSHLRNRAVSSAGQDPEAMAGVHTLLLLLATATGGNAGERAPAPVILVTIDGVRYQEVFHGLDPGLSAGAAGGGGDLLPRMRARAAAEGFLTGDADRGDAFDVRNLGVCSLPAYLGILS
jgi:hypothetical protein